MNYIKHLNKVFEIFYGDERVNTFHIALYMSLFQHWNMNRFKNPVVFKRMEIMQGAKIGSLTTYTKCMRELSDWNYLKYAPTQNPYQSSLNMYSFCTSLYTSAATEGCTPSVQEGVHLLYTNNLKLDKQGKEENVSPTHVEVLNFFKEKEWLETEADKFFFHYQAVGWCTRNKTPILDWKAAAQKWNVTKIKFDADEKTKYVSKPGNLNAGRDKNYSEPL